jgi:hypothetical protein
MCKSEPAPNNSVKSERVQPDTDAQTNIPFQRLLIRKQNDTGFEEGVVDLFVSENGRLCVTKNKGFDMKRGLLIYLYLKMADCA